MANMPIVTFLSDFGTRDYYVGSVKGVILEHCPEAQIVDISHEIRSHDLLEAAFTLACAAPCYPRGTVHLAVVDPGVGSGRRAIAASDGYHFYVGPDNGIFSLIYQQTEMGRVVSIEAEHYYRQPVSATFHGRDIFAPIAGQLARGIELGKLGSEISDHIRLNLPPFKRVGDGSWDALVLHVDRFGNLITNIRPRDLEEQGLRVENLRFQVGETVIDRHLSYYSQAGPNQLFVLLGSSGYYEIAANRQSAAQRLGARRGTRLGVQG